MSAERREKIKRSHSQSAEGFLKVLSFDFTTDPSFDRRHIFQHLGDDQAVDKFLETLLQQNYSGEKPSNEATLRAIGAISPSISEAFRKQSTVEKYVQYVSSDAKEAYLRLQTLRLRFPETYNYLLFKAVTFLRKLHDDYDSSAPYFQELGNSEDQRQFFNLLQGIGEMSTNLSLGSFDDYTTYGVNKSEAEISEGLVFLFCYNLNSGDGQVNFRQDLYQLLHFAPNTEELDQLRAEYERFSTIPEADLDFDKENIVRYVNKFSSPDISSVDDYLLECSTSFSYYFQVHFPFLMDRIDDVLKQIQSDTMDSGINIYTSNHGETNKRLHPRLKNSNGEMSLRLERLSSDEKPKNENQSFLLKWIKKLDPRRWRN